MLLLISHLDKFHFEC